MLSASEAAGWRERLFKGVRPPIDVDRRIAEQLLDDLLSEVPSGSGYGGDAYFRFDGAVEALAELG